MRRLFLLSLFPVLLAAQVTPMQLVEAEGRYLEAWDLRAGNEAIPVPPVSRGDRLALKWLIATSNQTLPANPFPKGGPSWKEAEAVRRFVQASPERWSRELQALPLTLSGSYLALWRWGQPRVRAAHLDKPLRQQWEDKLLTGNGPQVVRDLALRHALCFALAESDGERFAVLKDRLEEGAQDTFPKFQNAFALLGAPAPVVHLWTLPQMESVDLSLNRLGGTQIRFEPDPGQGLPELPPGTVWVVPTREGSQPASSSYLEGSSLTEAQQLVPRLVAAKRTAYLAPVRSVFETYALMYFPIQIEMDAQGTILSIRMGDAALVKDAKQSK